MTWSLFVRDLEERRTVLQQRMANRMCLRWFGMNTKGALGDDANSGKVHMLDRTTIITDTGRGGCKSVTQVWARRPVRM